MRNLGSTLVWAAISLCLVMTGCSGQTSPATAPMQTTYVLTVNSLSPASGVAIGVAPTDINGAGNGSTTLARTYVAGTSVSMTAPTSSGSNAFVSWSGCTSSTGATCTVIMSANTTVTANYVTPVLYTLTVNSTSPSTGVIVNATPADNTGKTNGTTGFALNYNAGTSVTLTAPASSGSNAFVSWSGCTSSIGATCTVIMSASISVTANYALPILYTLTVNSASPSTGVIVSATPDNSGKTSGTTSFSLTYNAGTSVVLTTPPSYAGYSFLSWTGCTTFLTVTCNTTMNGNTTVTVAYNQPSIQSVTVTPNQAVTIGTTQQFAVTVAGAGAYSSAVTWSLAGLAGSKLSPGTLSASGLYTTPYPAPASVNITATSIQDSTKSGSVTVLLAPPATSTGPTLTVDAANQTHPISPYIYGMNNYQLTPSVAKAADITVDRSGGDATSRYNYVLDVTSSASDWYFENQVGATGQQDTSQFNAQVVADAAIGAKTIGSVNVLGWVAKDGTSCSFPVTLYSNQHTVDPNRRCGDGLLIDGKTNITGVDPTATSVTAGPAFAGNWVAYLAGKFGTAANGGVAIYDLDNEPAWWDVVHRDVHPLPSTYDEVTNNGITTAQAIKAADPTAEVSGPVIDFWWNYFYSKKDIESGWNSGPCYQPWNNPVDRKAHGGVPFIEYYLQQFAAQQSAGKPRLLDYLDVHTYFAANYAGSSVGFATAGNTGAQQARLNSTRVFWDPTYTDPNNPQPNYSTDTNYTTSCSVPAQAPQVIPMMQTWIKNDYPGTKTAITEYNWGGQEAINGALAQADILGIFGSYGLDLGALWGPPDPIKQIPGLKAFQIYRNYDGNNSVFGNQALSSTSANQGTLSVYGALRTSDNAKTIVVINKSYGDLTSTLSLAHLTATANETAKVFLYSNGNLGGIVAQSAVAVSPPTAGSTSSTISATFPAQSITLLIVP